MTAVKEVSFVTRTERHAAERKEWIADAVGYLIGLGIYAQEEVDGCFALAESLEFHARDEGGELMYTAKEAVDEELSYWGD
jgi:hypothetical protein